jgi:hypothetical protein
MALQLSNTTADIYRSSNSPPANPDVAGVRILLNGDFATAHAAAVTTSTLLRWTHVALCDPTVDVRDGYQIGATPGAEAVSSQADKFFVPSQNGVQYNVLFVERISRGTAGDCKRVYLQRTTPTWPTNNV